MREIWSDKTDSIIQSLMGIFLSIGLLIYKIYFADNSADTAYEYWSFVIFFVVFFIISLIYLIGFPKQMGLAMIACLTLFMYVPIYNIIECVYFNRCFFWRTTHYVTSDDADYWISISIQLMFITIFLLIVIFYIRGRLKKRKTAKAIEITKQQRISKRMRERAKKRMEREKAKEYR
jgi:hypothetical protein